MVLVGLAHQQHDELHITDEGAGHSTNMYTRGSLTVCSLLGLVRAANYGTEYVLAVEV